MAIQNLETETENMWVHMRVCCEMINYIYAGEDK